MKKTIYQLRTVGVFATITLFAACSKEHTTDVKINPSKYLVFEVGNTDDWDAEHKSNVDKKSADGLSVGNIDGAADCAYTDDAVAAMEGMKGENKLYLHTSVSDRTDDMARIAVEMPATRNVPVTMDNFYNSFNVYGYAYEGTWSEDNTPSLIDNEAVSKIDGIWQTVNPHIWPGEGYVRFYAYAPADLSGLSVSAAKGTPKFSYTVPSDVADQKDLLIAATELEGNGDTPVKLTFRHPLTAVKFVTSANIIGGTINSLSVKNVYGTGTFTPDVSGAGAWSGQSTAVSYSQNLALSVSDGVADQEVAAGAKTFMLMPQTLPDGANITVNFTDSKGETFDLTASVAGTVWPMGKTVTYSISTANIGGTFVLDVTPTIETTYTGGSVTYNIKSYKVFKSGKIEPAAWTAQYSENDGSTWTANKPGWLTAFTASGTGSTTTAGDNYTATIKAQEGEGGSGSSLSSAAELGTEPDPYDLSMADAFGKAVTGMTTANCYVVRAGGWYRIPLVYGNAVKNGAVNTSAYNPGSVSGGLATFVKHDNAAITAPCLADNSGVVPANATMVWNDVSASFISVKATLSKFNATIGGASKSLDYIVFNIPKASIRAGNAVIAVRNSDNETLWSWHIWVTGDDLTPVPVTNYMNEVNNMMPVNLGWVSATGTTHYPERSCLVRISQTGTSNTKTITVTRKEGYSTEGNCPFYQWGRKDPFLPSNGTNANTDKTYAGTKWTYQASTTATIGDNIKNPTIHYYNSSKGACCNTQYNNMWSAKNTKTNVAYNVADEDVVKTVYDPCPAGFTVAPTNAYTGFTTTGRSSSTKTEWNVVSTTFNKGYTFYCGKNKTGGTIFFPAAGYRSNSSGALGNVATSGYYWAAVPSSATGGRYLGFGSSSVSPLSGSSRAGGYCVRPVQE